MLGCCFVILIPFLVLPACLLAIHLRLLAALDDSAVRRLVMAYDALCERTLLPLPQMDADPVRAELDAAVCAALDVDAEQVAIIRRHIAAEPSVTGRRYRGLGG